MLNQNWSDPVSAKLIGWAEHMDWESARLRRGLLVFVCSMTELAMRTCVCCSVTYRREKFLVEDGILADQPPLTSRVTNPGTPTSAAICLRSPSRMAWAPWSLAWTLCYVNKQQKYSLLVRRHPL